MLHCLFIGRQGYTGTTLGVGYQQGPCLSDAVAPCCDIAALQSAVGLVGRIFCLLRQLALATHTLLAVFPGVVEVTHVDTNTQDATYGKACCSTQPLLEGLLADGIDKISQTHEAYNKEVVIGHLHVIAENLQGCEDTRYHHT